ncbi:MAG: SipW-dependent-type signal peptide-containing protein [Ruminococcus sp.]|nr:SipW-dependent-type signal peptide-containing protein [Ruminococcus sp.]
MEKKRLTTTVAAVALLGALAVGGTLAYLTDTETKTNNFTIAKDVDIDLTETKWNPDVTPDPDDSSDAGTKNTVPNALIDKNPVVVNKGDENIVTFVEVRSPKAMITTQKGGSPDKQELFFFGTGTQTKLTANAFNVTDSDSNGKNWVLLDADDTDDDYVVYLFGYNSVVAGSGSTESVFDYVYLKNYISSDSNPDAAKIIVTAYAIQADNLYDTDNSSISTTSLSDAATLKKIFATYKADAVTTTSGGASGSSADPATP